LVYSGLYYAHFGIVIAADINRIYHPYNLDPIGEDMKLFKTCSGCKTPWFSRDEFLQDSNIVLVGYQVNFGDRVLGYFLFNHALCQSTIGIPAGHFKDLHDGPIFSECLAGSEQCPGHCLNSQILDPCPAKCEGAYVRNILQILREWPKDVCYPGKIAVGQC
jgi:hypothetical protein